MQCVLNQYGEGARRRPSPLRAHRLPARCHYHFVTCYCFVCYYFVTAFNAFTVPHP